MRLMKEVQSRGSGSLDQKTAGLMLYALQTASCNLRNLDFEPQASTDVVIDRDDIHRTYIGGQQWFEEDFDEDAEDEDVNETVGEAGEEVDDQEGSEDEDEAAIAARSAVATAAKKDVEAVKKEPPEAKKHITI